MKWRKMTGLLITGSIAAGMLFGCGGKDEGNTTDTKGEEVQESTAKDEKEPVDRKSVV